MLQTAPHSTAASESKLRSVVICDRVDAEETGWQSGMRSCTMPGLPTYLVGALTAGTVGRWQRGLGLLAVEEIGN